ncbi:MAG TPA: non-homologous end-joining DNA ligase [Solirubrobacteraceae bacterium]|nr:non-homologous end-joining DNA ligase [Solirubrobacteraceae bacterium]
MSATIKAGRRCVEISRPGKALFPCGITKADLATYYERVARAMLPHIKGRPLNLERYPDGIEGERIMQQRAGRYFPVWIRRAKVDKKGGYVEHVVAADAATLVYLAGQACITLHPWLSRADRLQQPDRLIFDLDPSNGKPSEVLRAARTMFGLVRELGLQPWVMTSGSRGYHVTVPLRRSSDFDATRAFARDVAALASRREPRLFTTEQRKAKREGRILIDVMRNAYAHSAVAPYAVRARPSAPVAAPLHPDELGDSGMRPDRWTLRTLPRRLERDGDPWERIGGAGQAIGAARRRLKEAMEEL